MSKAYARIFQKGDIDIFGVRVKSTDIFTATDPTFELRTCPGYAPVLAETPADFVGDGPFSSIKQADIVYNLDTTELDPGEYVAIFGLRIDSLRRRLKKLNIRIEEDPCT